MFTFVVAKDENPLMPTSNIKKVRHLLKENRAEIFCYDPFAIRLLYDIPENEDGSSVTQPVELCEDTGDHHVGLSIKSEKHEYVSAQYDHLTDEAKRHENCRREHRRPRRHRKRYRKPRFDNRKKENAKRGQVACPICKEQRA